MENVEAIYNTYNLGEQWLERELQHVNFCDKRLFNRLLKTTSLIEGKASGSINQSCRTWKDAKGAYRLFSNEKCAANEIYASHHKETGTRIKGNKVIFAIQDTTYLDFDSHIKTTGLGSVSKAYKKHKMGLIIHSTLAVTAEGLPLGLSSQQCWSRPLREEEAQEKSRRIYRTSISNKESYKWITALKETVRNVPEGTQIITLGDREADIFEFLWTAQWLDTFFVVRNRQDRKFICSEGNKTKLQTRLKQLPVKAEIALQIPKRVHHEAREANIAIKYMTGFIPIRIPTLYGPKDTKHKINDKVAVCVVSAKEIDPPKGVEAIDWTLLTNVKVNSVEDAIERVDWYKLRWDIEEYFRVLKSGCKIEDARLSTGERLQKLIAIKSIIAFKILYLSKVALCRPEEACTTILTSEEWKTLHIREHHTVKLPTEPPTIKQAIIWLGKLGGFMSRKKDKLPGTMTLWRGYENLKESVTMLSIFISQTCG